MAARKATTREPAPAIPSLTTRSASVVDALVSAVIADPEADEPRLVLADFWQEKGDPRGELISVQCVLAKMAPKDRGRAALEARETALLKKHGKTWSAVAKAGKLWFERGFARVWKVGAIHFALHAKEVFAKEPIRVLDLSQGNVMDPTSPHTMRAFERSELSRVRRLELRRLKLRAEQAAEVFACKHLSELRELDISYMPMSLKALEALSTSATFTKLELLKMSSCKVDARVIEALAKAPFASSLRKLDLADTKIGNEGVRALATTKELAGLRSLDLSKCQVEGDAMLVIASSKVLAGLESLELTQRFKPEVQAQLRARFPRRG